MRLFSLFLMFFALTSCGNSPLFSPLESDDRPDKKISSLTNSEELTWKDSRHHFAIAWEKKPVAYENSPFRIKFWDSYEANFLGPYNLLEESLCVFLWMKMENGEHGSSPIVLTHKSSESGDYYYADDVYFVMSGKWQIRIRTVSDKAHCSNNKTDPYLEEYIIEVSI